MRVFAGNMTLRGGDRTRTRMCPDALCAWLPETLVSRASSAAIGETHPLLRPSLGMVVRERRHDVTATTVAVCRSCLAAPSPRRGTC